MKAKVTRVAKMSVFERLNNLADNAGEIDSEKLNDTLRVIEAQMKAAELLIRVTEVSDPQALGKVGQQAAAYLIGETSTKLLK